VVEQALLVQLLCLVQAVTAHQHTRHYCKPQGTELIPVALITLPAVAVAVGVQDTEPVLVAQED
jgi:hypothetical protein